MVTVDWRPPKCWFQPKKKPFKGPLVVTAVKYRCLPQWYLRSVANRLIDSLWSRWTQRLPVVFWNKFALTFKSYINWQCFWQYFAWFVFVILLYSKLLHKQSFRMIVRWEWLACEQTLTISIHEDQRRQKCVDTT